MTVTVSLELDDTIYNDTRQAEVCPCVTKMLHFIEVGILLYKEILVEIRKHFLTLWQVCFIDILAIFFNFRKHSSGYDVSEQKRASRGCF